MRLIVLLAIAALIYATQCSYSQVNLEGSLEGFLQTETYHVIDNIQVDENDTLIIEAGSQFLFHGQYSFALYGLLICSGTEEDSILFTAADTSAGWEGIDFYGESSSFSLVEYSNIYRSLSSGVYCNNSSPTFRHCSVADNENGGFYLEEYSCPIIENCLITQNTSSNGAGLFCTLYSLPEMTNCIISSNTATFSGGGIASLNHSFPFLRRCTISENNAGSHGGGLSYRVITHMAEIEDCTIFSNSAGLRGGGIYCDWHAGPTVRRSLIYDNYSGEDGGAIYLIDSEIDLVQSTMASNTAVNNGGGIFFRDNGRANILNSILWYNYPNELYFHPNEDPNRILSAYSDIRNSEGGIVNPENGEINWLEGNLQLEPLFIDPDNHNYHLSENSPCIDSGSELITWMGDTLLDYTDDLYFGPAPDMGVFEYSPLVMEESSSTNHPSEFSITSIYPNPFNNKTTIEISSPTSSIVEIRLFNLLGQLIIDNIKQHFAAGYHKITFDAKDLTSGVYLVKATIPGMSTRTRKIVVVK